MSDSPAIEKHREISALKAQRSTFNHLLLAGVMFVLLFLSRNILTNFEYIQYIELIFLMSGLTVLFRLYLKLNQNTFKPLLYLREWSQRRHRIESLSDIPALPDSEVQLIIRRIAVLGKEIANMRDLLDDDDLRQTRILAQKSRSLQVLYDVAASINIFNDLDDLLTRFLHTLIDVVNAHAATVRLLDKDESQMRLVASVGLSDEALVEEGRRFILAEDIKEDIEKITLNTEGDKQLQSITVPLRYHGKTLGVYNLIVEQEALDSREDIMIVLISIGRHLGIAIEKVRLDLHAHRLTIMQERSQLAHELHDSLAQTLAGLRFQIRLLEDTLQNNDLDDARVETLKIKDNLDTANRELRGLLKHFRAPMDKRGLIPALEDMITEFRHETGMVIFFQRECDEPGLPTSQELQLTRIIQESLANIKKHSQAHAVRLLLKCNEDHYYLMIEDDGIGLSDDSDKSDQQHYGLSILQERAEKLGGTLTIDSEPGEGTRVELSFKYPLN